MQDSTSFDVRFHRASANWPGNALLFQGAGQVLIEPDFVTLHGVSHRSFRFPKRERHRLRMVDILNVRVEGPDVLFHVSDLERRREIGFSTPDRASARAIAALLPERWTDEFKLAYTERETFHDRMDYWSPSTPAIWTLLAANILIFLAMWLELQGILKPPPRLPFKPFPGWGAHDAVLAHAQLMAQGLGRLPGMLAEPKQWWTQIAALGGWGKAVNPAVLKLQLLEWGSNMPLLTLGASQHWRLLTSMFLHGNLLHLLFNMFTLWQVGQLCERVFGSARFIGLYLLAGLCGSLASLVWNLLTHHAGGNSVGASGAIFGIIGGLLAFIGRTNSGVPPTVVQDLRGAIAPFLLFNIAAGFVYPHTDNAAHIGGLVGGYLAGHLLARSLHVPAQPTPRRPREGGDPC
ncbi:rhomboid family intramembrane serine protease [Massilia forsythiae]|uniref:Rhomboid family intramembrane serine protease n=2 Tax=Massilia forsythiae TaxID=2728020 RepID=A0A7Z2ZRC3_9BURK|nr:rhomboid family intramembrane serine protease [Massilia forsythiae]